MYKKIFAGCFLIVLSIAFYKSQEYLFLNNQSMLHSENKETILEEALPYSDILKEIYGYSNRVISPNEIISDTTATIKDSDGFLRTINIVDTAVVDRAKFKISELNDVCQDSGVEFSFIFYPSKNDSSVVPMTYGVDTNYEEVRADFIQFLESEDLDYLNVRELLENDGYNVKDIFYKTDHHWTTEAGLYAARKIGDYLNNKYDWRLNTTCLNQDKFTYTNYEKLWLGETGRSVSKSWVESLDDFTQIMPNFETSISQRYPDGTENNGDFSIMIDTSGYDGDIDYYKYSAHYSYSNGMGSPMTYHNNLDDGNGKNILLIKDSFSVVVIPFLILETSDITVWDMRLNHTKNGLYKYIKDNNFDLVLVAYTDFWRDDVWNFN